jgi:hypothetical protein
MYDLINDPLETTNLACSSDPAIVQKRNELANLLSQLEQTELPRSIEHVDSE